MLRIIYLIILFFIISLVEAQIQPMSPEYEKDIMKKNRISTQTRWKYRPGSTTGEKVLTKSFDKNGNVVEEINFKPDGSRSSRLSYKYDERDNKIYYQLYDFMQEPEKRVRYVQNMVYNEHNDRISETGFDGIADFEIIYKYLKPGKLSEIVKYNSKKQVTETRKYAYSDKLRTISIYNATGALSEKIVEKYDAKGNTIEKATLKPDNSTIKKNIYKYNEANKLVDEEEYYGSSFSAKYEYIYNSKGYLLTIEKEESSGKTYTNNSYNYDVKGNLIEELWYDGNPDDYSRKIYNYDEKDNVKEVDSYFSMYRYKVLYKYTYEYY